MLKILFHHSFKRAYKRSVSTGSEREEKFRSKLELFTDNPFNPSLRTHKLKGRLNGYWSFSIEYDLRVIFYFEDEETVVLFDIGSHDDVY